MLSVATMKIVIGAIGWATVLALTVGLTSCDDSKATCEKMCTKVEECVPEQVKEMTKNLPAGAEKMAKEMKEKMLKELEKSAAECKKKCGEGGKVSDADKKKIGKVKACLDKDCKDFMKCMEDTMK